MDDVPDGGGPTPSEIAPPMEPAIAELPHITCPAGWARAISEGEHEVCDPFPDGVPDCAGATIAVPGGDGCEPIGTPCPEGDFPTSAPTDAVFVKPGASGPGTREAPFGTIAAAIAAGARTIVLGAGGHLVPDQPGDLELIGACPERTTIRGPNANGVLTSRGGHLIIRNLTIVGENTRRGVTVAPDSSLVLEDVLVDGARGTSVSVPELGEVSITHVRVHAGRNGEGIACSGESHCDLTGVMVDGIAEYPALFVEQSSEMVVEDAVLIGATGENGMGIFLRNSGSAELDRVAVYHTDAQAIFVTSRSTMTARDVVIDDSSAPGTIFSSEGSTVALTRGYIRAGSGAASSALEATLRLTDVLFEGTRPFRFANGETLGGLGVFLLDRSTLELERVAIEGGAGMGFVSEEGARATGHDLVVANVASEDDGRIGFGLDLLSGSTFEIDRVRLDHTSYAALTMRAATAIVRDLVIRDTQPQALDGDFGLGIAIVESGSLTIERGLIERSQTGGVSVSGAGNTLIASDLVIRDTAARATDGRFGRGLEVHSGAIVELTRAVIARNDDFGIIVSDADTSATMRDVLVEDTRVQSCAGDTCVRSFGMGVGVYGVASLDMERFTIRRSALCGVAVAQASRAMLRDGTIAMSPAAVCAENDISRVMLNQVRFDEIERTFDATELPVPEPTTPVGL